MLLHLCFDSLELDFDFYIGFNTENGSYESSLSEEFSIKYVMFNGSWTPPPLPLRVTVYDPEISRVFLPATLKERATSRSRFVKLSR